MQTRQLEVVKNRVDCACVARANSVFESSARIDCGGVSSGVVTVAHKYVRYKKGINRSITPTRR